MANTTIPSELIQADVALGGSPTTTTQSAGNNTTKLATTAFVTTAVNNLIASAPGTMDTLNEIAAALNDDPDFTTTVNNAIATKLPLAGGTMTGNLIVNASLDISGDIDVDGTTNLDVVDIDGAVDMASSLTMSAGGTISAGGANDLILNAGASGTPDIYLQSGGATKVKIDGGGRVMIGTTSNSGVSNNADELIIGNNTASTETGITLCSTSASGIRWNDGADVGVIEYVHTDNRMAFYTAGSERMRLDSVGRLGIGETSPETSLHIKNAGNSFLTLERSGTTGGTGKFGINMEGGSSQQTTMAYDDGGKLVIGRSSDPATMAGFNNDFVLDSSGNLLVGTTSTTVGGGGSGVTGFRVDGSSGIVQAAASGNTSAIFNRTSSDGDIVSLRKNGSEVGSIGTANSGDLYIGNDDTTLLFAGGSDAIIPRGTAGATRDAAIDLGLSAHRFKHLYFSGGLYGGSEVQTATVGVGTVASGSSVGRTTSAPDGVFWHNGSGMTDYAIYRTAGAWSGSNYQQLKLDWDTGIILDGGTAYGKSGVHIHGNISMGDSTYSNFTSPNYPVHICADGYGLMIESGTGYGHLGSNNTSYFHFGGNRSFYFDNRCEANGGFHTYSDENLKKEITVIPSALNKVAQMNGVTFKWKDAAKRGGGDSGKQFGVTAQNMLAVDSELPTKNIDPLYNIEDGVSADDEYYTMDYTRITPFLIEAVKELKTKLEAAEARIATLEG